MDLQINSLTLAHRPHLGEKIHSRRVLSNKHSLNLCTFPFYYCAHAARRTSHRRKPSVENSLSDKNWHIAIQWFGFNISDTYLHGLDHSFSTRGPPTSLPQVNLSRSHGANNPMAGYACDLMIMAHIWIIYHVSGAGLPQLFEQGSHTRTWHTARLCIHVGIGYPLHVPPCEEYSFRKKTL